MAGDYLCFILGLLLFTSAMNLDTLYFLFPSLIYTLPPGPSTHTSLGGSFSTTHPLTFFFGCRGSFSGYMLSGIDWKLIQYLCQIILLVKQSVHLDVGASRIQCRNIGVVWNKPEGISRIGYPIQS